LYLCWQTLLRKEAVEPLSAAAGVRRFCVMQDSLAEKKETAADLKNFDIQLNL